MSAHWDISEAGAEAKLDQFLTGAVVNYEDDRNIPSRAGSSMLSPYLQSGIIGPRQIVSALSARADMSKSGPFVYLKEIYWREFAYNVLYHFPYTSNAPLQAQYDDFPWEANDHFLKRWQTGHTGYPIVDAGMRELYATGWMHNRVRMIAASLLVKHLLQDWKDGARWFWDTLVDADLASNSLGWQWSGGCGADAAPYFRVFNPIIQGSKFDPEGAYVRKYVPELARLPAKYIHTPWEAPTAVLEAAGIELDVTYPRPIVDHPAGRARALAAFEAFKTPTKIKTATLTPV
jgi:deoxyribodipyrimidine photo-lyase